MHAQDTTSKTDVNTDNQSFFDSARFKLFNAISERNFNINPFYIKLTGSIASGYFLTQLLFLARRYNYAEFYKTDDYFMEKLCMTEKEVRNHKKNLIDLGYIFVIKTGFPATSHYKVNVQKIIEIAEQGDIAIPSINDPECPENRSHAQRASLQKPTSNHQEKDGTRTAQRADQSRPKGVTDYINDLDNNNNKESRYNQEADSSHQAPVVVSEDLKTMLHSIGLEDDKFWVKTYGEAKIREKFSFMPPKSKIESSEGAWMRMALQRDYPPPKSVFKVKNGGSSDEVETLYQQRMKDGAEEAERRRLEYLALAAAQPTPVEVISRPRVLPSVGETRKRALSDEQSKLHAKEHLMRMKLAQETPKTFKSLLGDDLVLVGA